MSHRFTLQRCVVCELPMTLNIPMDPVITICESARCNHSQPCIHGWLEKQHRSLCPVCESGVGGNRFKPNFGSSNTIDDNRNNVSPAAGQRTETTVAFTRFISYLGLYWTFVLMFIIILVILCVTFFIFL